MPLETQDAPLPALENYGEDASCQERQWASIQRIRALRTQVKDAVVERALADATDALLEATRGLLWSIVHRSAAGRRAVDRDELFTEAVLKMMQCIDGYDPAVGRFSTYVATSVECHLWGHVADEGMIRIPKSMQSKLSLARKAFRTTHGREPSDDELVEAGFMPAEDMALIRRARSVRQQTDRGGHDDEGGNASHLEISDDADSHVKGIETSDEMRRVAKALDIVERRNAPAAQLLRLLLGINEHGILTGEPQTFAMIALRWDISVPRVARLHAVGMRLLQEVLRGDQDEDHEEAEERDDDEDELPPVSVASAAHITVPTPAPTFSAPTVAAANAVPAVYAQPAPATPATPFAIEEHMSDAELLDAIYTCLRLRLSDDHRPVFDRLRENIGKPVLQSALLPQGVPNTQWQRKAKLLPAIRAIREVLEAMDFECGALLDHDPLHAEGGYALIHRSAVPFTIARHLTVFQWRLLNEYAAHDRRIITNRQVVRDVWGEEYQGARDDRRVQNIINAIRARQTEQGYHIAYMDRSGQEHGFLVALDSNIPASLRLSFQQTVVLSALLARYRSASTDDDAWVSREELASALGDGLAASAEGGPAIRQNRQELPHTIERLQVHLAGHGTIETRCDTQPPHALRACRVVAWAQPREDMMAEPEPFYRRDTARIAEDIPSHTLRSMLHRIADAACTGRLPSIPLESIASGSASFSRQQKMTELFAFLRRQTLRPLQRAADRPLPPLPGDLPPFVQDRFVEVWKQSVHGSPWSPQDVELVSMLLLHQGMLIGPSTLAQHIGCPNTDLPQAMHRLNTTLLAGTQYVVQSYTGGYAMMRREM